MRPSCLLLFFLALSCSRAPAPTAAHELPPVWHKDVRALVNGVAITDADVSLAGRADRVSHVPGAARDPAEIVATLVREELAAQRAVELGLDADPAYRAELARLEAQVAAFRRRKLADALQAAELGKQRVSEAETRRYFEAHAAELRSELRVYQILARDEAQIERAASELDGGAAFEDVAARLVPAPAHAERMPWDLGYLRWNQIPDAWREAVRGLRPGQTSGVIEGANRRFWIVKIVDRRDNPAITYEVVKEALAERLGQARAADARARLDEDLQRRARIVHAPASIR